MKTKNIFVILYCIITLGISYSAATQFYNTNIFSKNSKHHIAGGVGNLLSQDFLDPKFSSLGNLADLSVQSPSAERNEIDTIYEAANDFIKQHYSNAHRWNMANIFFTWLAFILSSLIAILAGFAGQFGQDISSDFSFLKEVFKEKQKKVKLIGVLAAIATVSSGVAVKTKEAAESEKNIANETRQKIIASYKEMDEAPTATARKQILENIKLITEQ